MTEILLICCICIKAPAECRCVESRSVNHTIISFSLSLLVFSLPLLLRLVLLLLLLLLLFFCLFVFVSFSSFIYIYVGLVFISGWCVSVLCMAQQTMTMTTTTGNVDCCSAFAYKHVFVAVCDDQLQFNINTNTHIHTHKHTRKHHYFFGRTTHICALVLSFVFSRSFFVCCFSLREIQFYVYAWLTMQRYELITTFNTIVNCIWNDNTVLLTKHTCAPKFYIINAIRIESNGIESNACSFTFGSKTAENPNCHLHSSRVHVYSISSKWSNPKLALKSNLSIHTYKFCGFFCCCWDNLRLYGSQWKLNIDRCVVFDQFFLFLAISLFRYFIDFQIIFTFIQ